MPSILEVELDAGDAAAGAGDLEVHVAEVVFVAHDVGQQDEAVRASLTRPIEMPADGIADRHAGIHQRQRAAADATPCELEPFDSRMSETTRIV